MSEEATKTFDEAITKLGDQLSELTLKQAVDLSDYMKDTYGIEPAAGGAVMMAGPAGGQVEEEEQTSFDVTLEAFGEKKIQVIKIVRELTSLGLKEAKELVDNVPKLLKEGVSKEEADKVKEAIEEVGGSVKIA
ncbi:MAG: 50S ribosomal protein L7/L12 [Phycisphaerales bacterium]|nr:50S ribosomal protein L7/L12 [Phycisphaerales bacterium]